MKKNLTMIIGIWGLKLIALLCTKSIIRHEIVLFCILYIGGVDFWIFWIFDM
jgi:hypothetical protein